jgi:hypothetical protein
MMEAVRTNETSVDNHSSLMMEAVRTSETSVDNHFTPLKRRSTIILHGSISLWNVGRQSFYTAVYPSETSVDNHFTRQYIPEDNSEHHTRRHENLKSHIVVYVCVKLSFSR